jgi:general stress protein CsbA
MSTLQTFLHNKWIVIIASLVIGFAIYNQLRKA